MNDDLIFKAKYLKYKKKYLTLKYTQFGGGKYDRLRWYYNVSQNEKRFYTHDFNKKINDSLVKNLDGYTIDFFLGTITINDIQYKFEINDGSLTFKKKLPADFEKKFDQNKFNQHNELSVNDANFNYKIYLYDKKCLTSTKTTSPSQPKSILHIWHFGP